MESNYADYLSSTLGETEYKEHLDSLYSDPRLRPYACILLHKYYIEKGGAFIDHANALIDEMHNYTDNNEVVKFLFKYYGRRLFDPNNRIMLFRIARNHPILETQSPLSYHYFHFIAETYNRNFSDGRRALQNIQNKYSGLNPDFHYVWKDGDGNDEIMNGQVVKNQGQRYKAISVYSLQHTVRLVKGNYENYKVGQKVKVKLHFYLYGLMAEIVGVVDESKETSD